MNRSVLLIAAVAIVAAGSIAVGAAYRCGTHGNGTVAVAAQGGAGDACDGGHDAHAGASMACDADHDASSATASGGATGKFDPMMAGCRFSCATKQDYQAGDVHTQPGARAGELTQCPVSGVVFAVDTQRPHVRIGEADYVTCCDQCANKLKRDPGRYLKT